jgi:hypothetical protein
MVTGYCVKCKEKGVELSAPEIVQTKQVDIWPRGSMKNAEQLFAQ